MKLRVFRHFNLRSYIIRYPALWSGIIIYSYLFFAIVQFLLKFRHSGARLVDVIEIFDALPFLWLLAYSLVKIIELRQQVLESENKRLRSERDAVIKETQLKTLHEVARSFRHRINTPLTIINFEVGILKRRHPEPNDLLKHLASIEGAVADITAAVSEFAKASTYEPPTEELNEEKPSHHPPSQSNEIPT